MKNIKLSLLLAVTLIFLGCAQKTTKLDDEFAEQLNKNLDKQHNRTLGEQAYQENNYELAKDLFELACNEENDSISCTNLGYMYEKGIGVENDFEIALKTYERACVEMHNGLACNNVGTMLLESSSLTNLLENEDGGKEEEVLTLQEKGMQMLEDSCAMGEKLGCFNLALFYYRFGDLESALEKMNEACDEGNGLNEACEAIEMIKKKL